MRGYTLATMRCIATAPIASVGECSICSASLRLVKARRACHFAFDAYDADSDASCKFARPCPRKVLQDGLRHPWDSVAGLSIAANIARLLGSISFTFRQQVSALA